jgi:hypothetical protein
MSSDAMTRFTSPHQSTLAFPVQDCCCAAWASEHAELRRLHLEQVQIGARLRIIDPLTGQPAVKNVFYPSKAGTPPRYSSENPDSAESLYQDRRHRGRARLTLTPSVKLIRSKGPDIVLTQYARI